MLVGVGNPFVIFLAILVFVGVRIRIAPAPEFFDEAFALVVSLQLLESLALVVSDDVRDVLIEPIAVSLLQFDLLVPRLIHRILIAAFLFLRHTRRHSETQGEKSDGQAAQTTCHVITPKNLRKTAVYEIVGERGPETMRILGLAQTRVKMRKTHRKVALSGSLRPDHF